MQEKVACGGELGADGYVVGDVSSIDSDRIARDAIHQLGRIDVLVCNVGSGKSARPEKSALLTGTLLLVLIFSAPSIL